MPGERLITRGGMPCMWLKVVRIGKTEAHESLTPPEKKCAREKEKLVIVESPAKAKTVGRFLGKGI